MMARSMSHWSTSSGHAQFKKTMERVKESWDFLIVKEEEESVDYNSKVVIAKSEKRLKTERRKMANEKVETWAPRAL